jgi:hypothetical protein
MSFFLLERLGIRQVATPEEATRKKSVFKLYHYRNLPGRCTRGKGFLLFLRDSTSLSYVGGGCVQAAKPTAKGSH